MLSRELCYCLSSSLKLVSFHALYELFIMYSYILAFAELIFIPVLTKGRLSFFEMLLEIVVWLHKLKKNYILNVFTVNSSDIYLNVIAATPVFATAKLMVC